MKNERAVLGSLIKCPKLFFSEIPNIKSEYFSDPLRQKIFETICSVGIEVDFNVMTTMLDASFHNELIECVSQGSSSITNLHPFVEELQNKYWSTHFGKDLSLLAGKIFNRQPFEDPKKLIDEIYNLVFKYCSTNRTLGARSFAEIIPEYMIELEKRIIDYQNGKPRGISTGLSSLDNILNGFIPGKYYILAARTSVGKTTLAINFVYHAMKQNKSVLFFSAEMTEKDILEKFLSLDSNVCDLKLTKGAVENDIDKIHSSLEKLNSNTTFINSRFGSSIQAIETEAKIFHQKGQLDFIVVDYIGLLEDLSRKNQNTHAEISSVSKRIRMLSQSLNIPILVLVQINREAEKSDDKIPKLYQLKDSGSLEQDADFVMLLYADRNDYWLSLEKTRKGGTKGRIKLGTDLDCSRFFNHEDTKVYE